MFLKEVFKRGSIESLDHETLFTIQRFFENNLNVSETSRKLFVHRNTLVYRLEKIKKITGLDLREFEDAIVFKVALMGQEVPFEQSLEILIGHYKRLQRLQNNYVLFFKRIKKQSLVGIMRKADKAFVLFKPAKNRFAGGRPAVIHIISKGGLPLIEFRNVSKVYNNGTEALHNINLKVTKANSSLSSARAAREKHIPEAHHL